jgi:hypothetical protein
MIIHFSNTPEFFTEAGIVDAGIVEGDYFMHIYC